MRYVGSPKLNFLQFFGSCISRCVMSWFAVQVLNFMLSPLADTCRLGYACDPRHLSTLALDLLVDLRAAFVGHVNSSLPHGLGGIVPISCRSFSPTATVAVSSPFPSRMCSISTPSSRQPLPLGTVWSAVKSSRARTSLHKMNSAESRDRLLILQAEIVDLADTSGQSSAV